MPRSPFAWPSLDFGLGGWTFLGWNTDPSKKIEICFGRVSGKQREPQTRETNKKGGLILGKSGGTMIKIRRAVQKNMVTLQYLNRKALKKKIAPQLKHGLPPQKKHQVLCPWLRSSSSCKRMGRMTLSEAMPRAMHCVCLRGKITAAENFRKPKENGRFWKERWL